MAMSKTCMGGVCAKCMGVKAIVIGLIFVANQYWRAFDWFYLIGVLFILCGLMKLFMPSCSHCK